MNILCFQDRVINLNHVCVIKFDRLRKKLFFNLDFVVLQKDGKIINDCIVFEVDDNFSFNDIVKYIYPNINFYFCNENTILNLNCISSLKYVKDLNRVIVNLSTPKTFVSKDIQRVKADFLYIENMSEKDFNDLKIKLSKVGL